MISAAVPDEDHPVQVLILNEVYDIPNVGFHTNHWMSQVGAGAQPGECGGEHVMSASAQERSDFLPAPTSVPGRVYQHKYGSRRRVRGDSVLLREQCGRGWRCRYSLKESSSFHKSTILAIDN
jgi:hypothetical protein